MTQAFYLPIQFQVSLAIPEVMMSFPTPITPKSFPAKGRMPNTRRENGPTLLLAGPQRIRTQGRRTSSEVIKSGAPDEELCEAYENPGVSGEQK